ncbi:glycosyltransferase [Mangrovimonas sp. AS39]|uniref:glycosyltransferase family 4 protein n=1 Tax=Mangrovimonas futianensis TaxID=2895523 RepID=UPI001E28D095|nr:glycosyltransferase family 4 protein [Mangrovimonas futianensis]MCF1191228.1 glycosyltransferase [Mangrovimonas futianensis]MCF1194923.1 glycosyltransferase [Mangrovimonas futianensis]
MKQTVKIAIFSGVIPSTTFIEHVITGVGKQHEVLLFGVKKRSVRYSSKQIRIHETPSSHYLNLVVSAYRLMLLGVKSPKSVLLLFKEIQKYPKIYNKWIWFTKFLPIVLYRPDILHLQWARDMEFYWFLKERFGIKIVLSLLGSHINYSPILIPKMADIYRKTFPQVDAFHAVSQAISWEAQKYYAPAQKIKVIHSPIKEKTFDFYRPPTKHGNRPLELVSVGRHHWVKGYIYALLALAYLRDHLGIVCHYTIIAQGEVPESLLFMRYQLGLETLVRFQSGLPQETLFVKIQEYDALLLPSLNEGIANVVLEAMALGVPVISTNCGGMAEVVHPCETGWLVPVREPEAMANAVMDVINTPEQALQLIAQNAHDFVKAQFSAKERIAEFLKLYHEVLIGE